MGGEAVASGVGAIQDARDQTHERATVTEPLECLEQGEKSARACFGSWPALEDVLHAPLSALFGQLVLRAGGLGFSPGGAVRWHRWLEVDLS